MAPRRRFERPTCRLGGGCSILLSYRGSISNVSAFIISAKHFYVRFISRKIRKPARVAYLIFCFLAEYAEVFIICRSDFSREYLQFATKVAPPNTFKSLCVLCENKYIACYIRVISVVSFGARFYADTCAIFARRMIPVRF